MKQRPSGGRRPGAAVFPLAARRVSAVVVAAVIADGLAKRHRQRSWPRCTTSGSPPTVSTTGPTRERSASRGFVPRGGGLGRWSAVAGVQSGVGPEPDGSLVRVRTGCRRLWGFAVGMARARRPDTVPLRGRLPRGGRCCRRGHRRRHQLAHLGLSAASPTAYTCTTGRYSWP